MTTTNGAMPKFEAPGPGSWEMDAGHFPRPVFGIIEEIVAPAIDGGMRLTMSKYGMLLETFDVRVVHGFPYMSARPIGAPAGGKPPPPWLFKLIFKTMLVVHPEIRRRMRSQRDLFQRRPWRDAVRLWDEQLRTQTVARHAAVDAIDLASLDDAGLAAHVLAVRDHACAILTQDHSMNLDVMLPVGDFLCQVSAWTSASTAQMLELLRGHSAISAGDSPERRALVTAIEGDRDALALLEGDAPAADTYRRLLAWPGEVGEAMRAYRIVWGNMICHGITFDAPSVDEEPTMLLGALRTCIRTPNKTRADEGAAQRMRDRVPQEHRVEFDVLLEDARCTYRLRDERHLYGALPCLGLGRRIVLEAGRRLEARGALRKARLAIVARAEELARLLTSDDRTVVKELEERMRLTEVLEGHKVPARLGPSPEPPPPLEWLPHESARRAMRALDAYLRAMGDADVRSSTTAIEGMPVSEGVHEGTARLCATAADLDRVRPGDVLVASSTTPAINVVLPMLGAIVTDRGGALSHAAIVCREYGIPGVVGTRIATTTIPDGARVKVDGGRGVVTVLS